MAFNIRRNGNTVYAPLVFTSAVTGGDGASAHFCFRNNSTTYMIPMVQAGKVVGSYAYRPSIGFQMHAYKNGVIHAVNGSAPWLNMNYKVTATRSSTGYGTTLKYSAKFSQIVLTVNTSSPGMGAAIPISYSIGGKSGTVTLNAGVTSQSFTISLGYTTALTTSSDPVMSMTLSIASGNYYAGKGISIPRTVRYSESGSTVSLYSSPQLSGMASKIF